MSAENDFHDLLATAPDPADDPYRPSRITAAAAHALGAAGASLSVKVNELRFPLGTSDADAARAESAQFTLGTGPCLEAIERGIAVDASAADLDRRWPELARRWRDQTPYRSAASFPVEIDGVVAALDVYLRTPDGCAGLDNDDADTVVSLIGRELDVPTAGQLWDTLSPRGRRGRVWIAIGIVGAHAGLDASESLARLRDYARRRDTEVDRLGQLFVEGSLHAADVVS